ncbi:MAG: LacI family DNA-binding transcriptional regulator [Chloroflexi bacterium]|nr:LacI family DNA-binding transcriptional regulator [Chloroflexota bacterium]
MNIKTNPPTIADVAKKAGVSIATVSRVWNGSSPVINTTAERVRIAIADLNYAPRPAARVLARRRTDTIGLVLPEISGAFFSPMLRGIETGVREADFGLLIQSTHASHLEKHTSRAMGEHNTDGLIIFPGGMDEKEIRRLHGLGFPLVLMHLSAPEGLSIPMVTVENKSGANLLVEHLINIHGRRKIAFLQGPEGHADSAWRERGYCEALQNHNLPFSPELIGQGGFSAEIAQAAVQKWLQNGLEFDAIFAGDDEAASGALQALREAGKRVPQDVSVVGFDDISFSRYLNPPLTTVRAPTEQVGLEAVRLLVKLIRNENTEAQVLLPTNLVIRQSCGCE